MKVLERGIMPNGTSVQIEDWSKDYSFMNYGSTLATYPQSKKSHKGVFAPKENEKYRFSFKFTSFEETKKAFEDLIKGEKSLLDFKENYDSKKEYIDCI